VTQQRAQAVDMRFHRHQCEGQCCDQDVWRQLQRADETGANQRAAREPRSQDHAATPRATTSDEDGHRGEADDGNVPD
jgi:hypothetical protein